MKASEKTAHSRVSLLVAKFARSGLQNVSSMARKLLNQGLVREKVVALTSEQCETEDFDLDEDEPSNVYEDDEGNTYVLGLYGALRPRQ